MVLLHIPAELQQRQRVVVGAGEQLVKHVEVPLASHLFANSTLLEQVVQDDAASRRRLPARNNVRITMELHCAGLSGSRLLGQRVPQLNYRSNTGRVVSWCRSLGAVALTVGSVPRRIVPELRNFNWLLKMNNQSN